MTTESLILRRCYPVPVTFADLRQAHEILIEERRALCSHLAWLIAGVSIGGVAWNSAIKEATGATDEVCAVIDGREVRVATVTGSGETATANMFGPISTGQAAEILIAADEAGYWERPHEVRVVLQERPVSIAAVERAVNVGWTARGGSA